METILIQERDEDTFAVVATALQLEGYRTCGLTDQDGNILGMIGRHHPKIILIDCWLNHYPDTRVVSWIKSHFPRVRVIAFSCDQQIAEQYGKLGFDDYILKPFELDRLYAVIRKNLPGPPLHPIKVSSRPLTVTH